MNAAGDGDVTSPLPGGILGDQKDLVCPIGLQGPSEKLLGVGPNTEPEEVLRSPIGLLFLDSAAGAELVGCWFDAWRRTVGRHVVNMPPPLRCRIALAIFKRKALVIGALLLARCQ